MHDLAAARDGTPIAYRQWGDPAAPNRLALIHALAMDGGFWEPVAQAMGASWQVLAVDCRGHGASGKPAGPYSVDLFADDLAAALDHAGWDKAAVAGASMGGCVALAFAARHPGRLTGLGLIDTTAWYGADAESAWEERGQKAVAGGMAALVGFQKSRWFSDAFRAARPEVVDAAVATFTANEVTAYLETCRMLGRADLRAALPGIAVPVQILVGAEDYATPIAMAEALQGAIPGAGLTVLPGVRHFTPLEVPGAIAARLETLGPR